MRLFETLLLVCVLILWIGNTWVKRRRFGFLISIACIGAALLHVIVEGYRWQMIPLYALTLGYLLVKNRKRRIWASVLFLFLWALSAALPLLLPVFTLDSPTGPYPVGTMTYDWTDASRDEKLTAAPDDRRELLVQLWYPAQLDEGAKKALYMPEYRQMGQAMHQAHNIPAFIYGYLGYVKMQAYASTRLAADQAQYPLLVFSHGLPGTRFTSTMQMEELASHGYLVCAIQHTGYASATVFSDQHVVPKTKTLPPVIDIDAWDQLIQTWVQDAQFVLDEFGKLNQNDPQGLLTGKINMDQIGMLGHSFGGAATVQTLHADKRMKAGVNMDGTPFGKAIADGLPQPFMLMKAGDAGAGNDAEPTDQQLAKIGVSRQAFDKYKTEIPARTRSLFGNGGYTVTFQGIKHMSFTDYYAWSPALRWMDGLHVSPKATRSKINSYVLAFFDKYLKQLPAPLLDNETSPYLDVIVEKK
ncbi:alpha/beta hydrolase family protein [Paenibacillus sp. SI8]|uniref:alpha/beta hydrolase family protein n=1 Tax=unclassified Paenibacillus TaxID=185978 RepID=UPI0034662CA0